MRLSILFMSLIAFALISCGGNKKSDNQTTVNETTIEQTNNDQIITEKYWKLIKLDGKDVEMVENQEREIFFILKSEDNTVGGFAGCNSITGEFELEDGNRIHFKNIGLTMMSCPDVDIDESELMEVFELADNYRITNDVLELNVGKRAPLAVFEAIYF